MGCFRLKESSGVIRALVCAAIGALGLSAWADTEVSWRNGRLSLVKPDKNSAAFLARFHN